MSIGVHVYRWLLPGGYFVLVHGYVGYCLHMVVKLQL